MTGTLPNQHDEILDDLLSDFLDESAILLQSLNDNLLELETWISSITEEQRGPCDESLMNEIFRSAHSLKGLSAMLGLTDINLLTHNLENVFDAARQNVLPLNTNVIERIFDAVDLLEAMVAKLANDSLPNVEYQESLREIEKLLTDVGVKKIARASVNIEDIQAEMTTESTQDEPATICTSNPPSVARDLFADTEDASDVPAKYFSIFIDETEMSLDSLTEALLAVEGQENACADENLLIIAHRIKGSAATIGLSRPAKLAHYMEDVLQEIRESGDTLHAGLVDALLKCTDGLRGYIESLKSGSNGSDQFNALALELVTAHAETAATKSESQESGSESTSNRTNKTQTSDSDCWTTQRKATIVNAAPTGRSGFIGMATFQPGSPLPGLKARLICEKLINLGDIFHCQPSENELEEVEELEQMFFGIATESVPNNLEALLTVSGVAQIAIETFGRCANDNPEADKDSDRTEDEIAAGNRPLTQAATSAASAPSPADPAAQKPADTSSTRKSNSQQNPSAMKPAETLRVDIERLDQLMNLAGQLVINKARFTQIGDKLKYFAGSKQTSRAVKKMSGRLSSLINQMDRQVDSSGSAVDMDLLRDHARLLQQDLDSIQGDIERFTDAGHGVNDLFDAVHQLDRVASGIQNSIMETRMVPIGPLFNRFKRVIRDITRGNGKDIDLVINGDKTELDKRMIDELGDPLIHMVRNSADHGIETPEERIRAGKPERGTVTLNAFHRGNSIVIQVIDDGKGIDPVKVRDKAISKGLLTAADAEAMTDQQLFQLIWEPGLTTAEKVTEVSGRGMGMDIVRSKIEGISGQVELNSKPGVGSTFTIKLPLTLAILPSLMARVESDVFAFPVESVVEIVSVPPQDISTIHKQRTAQVRGRVVSMLAVSEILDWNTDLDVQKANLADQDADKTVVIICDDKRELGLIVDELIGEEDVVIKSLAENYRNVEGVSGASILGDGRVSLILDTVALIDMAVSKSELAGIHREHAAV